MKLEFRTLKANEIDCRVSQIDKSWLSLLLYKDARVDMDILDETMGVMGWKKDYQLIDGQLFCTISIWDSEKNQWISKQDVGVESFSQEEKGRASDAQKRSAVCFGIGRELYTAPSIFITPRKDMGKNTKRKDENGEYIYEDEFFKKGTDNKGNDKYDTKTRFWVEYIDYNDEREIKDLIIRDNKNHIRFSQLTKETEKIFAKIDIDLEKAIRDREETDDKFDREKFYKYFEVANNSEMTIKQKQDAIKLLKEGK